MNRLLVVAGALVVLIAVVWALGRDLTSPPWDPTRDLDASALVVVEGYMRLAYGERDCIAADRLLDPPSAFLEKLHCRLGDEPSANKWSPPKLRRGCREERGIRIPGVPEGGGFDELGPFDCVTTTLMSLECTGTRTEQRAVLEFYLARRDEGWKISHVNASHSGTTFGGPPCTPAERARLRQMRS